MKYTNRNTRVAWQIQLSAAEHQKQKEKKIKKPRKNKKEKAIETANGV